MRNNTAFPNPHMFPLFGTSVFRLCSESDSLQTHKGFLSTLSSSIFSCHLVLVPPYSVKLQFYVSLFNYSPVSFLHHQTLGVYGLDFLLLFFSPSNSFLHPLQSGFSQWNTLSWKGSLWPPLDQIPWSLFSFHPLWPLLDGYIHRLMAVVLTLTWLLQTS